MILQDFTKILPWFYNKFYKNFTKILLRSCPDVNEILLKRYLDITKIFLRFCKINRTEKKTLDQN